MGLRRRRFVRAAGAMWIASLAGCFGSGDTGSTSTASGTDSGTNTAETTSASHEKTTSRTAATETTDPIRTRESATKTTTTPTATTAASTEFSTPPATTGHSGSTDESTPTHTTRSAIGSKPETESTSAATATKRNATTARRTASTESNATASTRRTAADSTETATSVAAEIGVGPGGKVVFTPEAVTVGVGETVRWRAESTGHNVCADPDVSGTVSIPDGAKRFTSYGTSDNPYTALMGVDETYEHTFETLGEYTYICVPHVLQGMIGRVTVTHATTE